MTLTEFLRARLAEDEQWALAVNRPYEYADEGSQAPATGVHWQWVTGENWEPVTPDPVTMEVLEGPDGSSSANLVTVEEWPSTLRIDAERSRTSMMPRTYAGSIEEMDPAAAGHIARHDPARVLAEVEAKRRIVELHEPVGAECGTCLESESDIYGRTYESAPCLILRLLALPHDTHPDYREDWRP